MTSKEEFIDKLKHSSHTNNLLFIINNKREYGGEGDICHHKKNELISIILKIVDEPSTTKFCSSCGSCK